jgi:hypothetical protein
MASPNTERNSMITQNFFKTLLLMCMPLIWAPLVWPVQAADSKPRREIEDKHFELVHIPLSPWPRTAMLNNYKPNFYGFWLDNTQLVMSVLQDVPDAYAKKLERIMLIDTSTGASRVLVDQGSLKCRSRKFQMMVYLPYHYQYGYYGDNPAQFRSDHRYVRVGSDGQLRELDGPSPIDQNCDPVGLNRDLGQSHPLLEGDGYIDTSARDDYEKKILGTAKLVRPGKPPLELGFPNAAVGAWPIYLPYYDKYLMSAWDYGTGGGRLGGMQACSGNTHITFRRTGSLAGRVRSRRCPTLKLLLNMEWWAFSTSGLHRMVC